jgi:hypothetical protein
MSDTYTVNSIAQVHQSLGLEKPKHPLVTVAKAKDFQPAMDFQNVKIVANLYQVAFKQAGCGTLQYGRNSYDYEEGTLLFTAPGQVLVFDNDVDTNNPDTEGWILVFHPDLIRKSDLGKQIRRYSFFDYDVNEALHLSDEERHTIEELLAKITREYSQNLDRHSQHLIVSNIQLLLDYCLRFYDRQFFTRTNLNSDVVSRFERLLKGYYQSEKAPEWASPTSATVPRRYTYPPIT